MIPAALLRSSEHRHGQRARLDLSSMRVMR
jgi:hypothetical protein